MRLWEIWMEVIGQDGNAPIQQCLLGVNVCTLFWLSIPWNLSRGSLLFKHSESVFSSNQNRVEAKTLYVRMEQDFAKTPRSTEHKRAFCGGGFSVFGAVAGEAQNREAGEDRGPGSAPLPLNVCGGGRYTSCFLLCTLCALYLLAPGWNPHPPNIFLRHSSLVSNQC